MAEIEGEREEKGDDLYGGEWTAFRWDPHEG
jgi:hypothetical protein